MNYKLKWYQYLFVPMYYLITILTSIAFTQSFTLDINYSLYLRIPISLLYGLLLIMSLLSHWISMQCNNSVDTNQIESSANEPNRECLICHIHKASRVHHCSVCNVCINRMDHHCPWIANCIGEHNLKAFILFLFYTSLGCLTAASCIAKTFIINLALESHLAFFTPASRPIIINQSLLSYETFMKSIITIGFYFSSIMGLVVILFFFVQVGQLCSGMTVIELKTYSDKKDCPYYNNDFIANFKEVFGNEVLLWFSPLTSSNSTSIVNNDYVPLL